MIRPTTGPTLPAALLLALAAFIALAALAGAEKITSPSGGITPTSFKNGCLGSGGILQEHSMEGSPSKSICYHNNKETSSCDWVKKTCTDTFLEPTRGGIGHVPVDGALVDDSPGTTQPGSGFGGVAAPTRGGVAVIGDEP